VETSAYPYQRNNSPLLTLIFYFLLSLLISLLQITTVYSEEVIVFNTLDSHFGKPILDGFKSVCGSSISIKEYNMRGRSSEGKQIIKEIKKRININPPKVILTLGTPATKLAQEAITEIPILFSMVVNPEKYGISGKNIRGITSNVPIKSQLVKLKKIVSKLKRIGVLYNPRQSSNIIEEVKQATSDMGLELITLKVSSPKKVQSSVRKIIEKVNALLLINDSTVVNKDTVEYIIETTLENKIPTVVYNDYLVKDGCLFSLAPDYFSVGEQAGNIVCKSREDKLRTPPSIIFPEVFKLSINLKTAKHIGLNIPPNIIASAEEIYR